MTRIFKVSTNWKHVLLNFGIIVLIRELKLSVAEVTLTSSIELVNENSPLTLTCNYKGNATISAFEMSLDNVVKLSVMYFNCNVLLRPNEMLYAFNCPKNLQLNWTVKHVTRAMEGDTWRCAVFVRHVSEKAPYTIHVHNKQEHTSIITTKAKTTVNNTDNQGHTGMDTATTMDTVSTTGNHCANTDNTGTIVGVILGLLTCALAFYAMIVTILLKRKTKSKDTVPVDNSTSQTTRVNLAYRPNVTEEQRGTNSDNMENSYEDPDTRYTSLDIRTRNDVRVYDVIQAQRFDGIQYDTGMNWLNSVQIN